MTFGIWAAVLAQPGIASAEPAADPSPDSSAAESPAGGTDSTTEPGVVSTGGSTSSAGGGSVESGSGSGASPDPDSGSPGGSEASVEPAPGVVIRSSGGALTSGEPEHAAVDQQSVSAGGATAREPAAKVGSAAKPASPAAGPVMVATAAQPDPSVNHRNVNPTTAAAGDRHVVQPERSVVTRIAVIPDRTAGSDVDAQIRDWPTQRVRPRIPASALLEPQAPSEPRAVTTTNASLRFVTNFLAAALAPFIVPLPGSPVDQPTQWAVLAWLRRQSDRNVLDRRPSLVLDPMRTEQVDARSEAADPPRATVESIDAVTGRVSGGVEATDHRRLRYELAEPIDRRLGSVTVDRHTGQWTFAPRQPTRLAAALGPDNGVVEFSIVASDGRAVDVRAPVDPAEAAVTGTIDLRHGLIYGLAAVADRLYVLNAASNTVGNGSVTVVDTSTRTIAGTIEVGGMPFGIAVGDRRLYVGNTDDGTVSVVDVASHEVVDVIDVGANPFGLAVSGDRLYVADHAGTVSVVDLGDNAELTRILVDGNPFAVAATADRVYVTDYAGGTVAVVDRATDTAVDPVEEGGAYPFYAAVVGRRLYVVNTATNALTIIDETGDTVVGLGVSAGLPDPIPAGAAPAEFLVRGDRLYVSNVNSGTVAVIDVASGQLVDTIAVGIHPGLLTATADGGTVYVADVLTGTVRVITSVRHIAEL